MTQCFTCNTSILNCRCGDTPLTPAPKTNLAAKLRAKAEKVSRERQLAMNQARIDQLMRLLQEAADDGAFSLDITTNYTFGEGELLICRDLTEWAKGEGLQVFFNDHDTINTFYTFSW